MKNLIFSILALFLIFNISCSNENPSVPQEHKGSATLKIDRVNAPEDVVEVIAYLSRSGFETLTGSMSLISDTTAEISFTDLEPGNWHLKVDATDESANVLYSGEADVEIIADQTIQVNLTLIPVSSGTGGINIVVNWGNGSNPNWLDSELNPILSGINTYYETYGVTSPKIIFEDNQYKMWFISLGNSGQGSISYAYSSDGYNWVRHTGNPVLVHGEPGTWDQSSVGVGPVIKEDGIYKMYYTGFSAQNETWSIGLATSPDGVNWTKNSIPILNGINGTWEKQVIAAEVLKFGDTYYLYYTGKNNLNYRIGLATSTDGINFERFGNNPILSPTYSGEGTGVYWPSIIEDEGIFKMVYMNAVYPNSFWSATSSDGISWTKDNSEPFFTVQNTHNYWCQSIAYPFLRKFDNEYRLYYSRDNYQCKIGVATSSNPF